MSHYRRAHSTIGQDGLMRCCRPARAAEPTRFPHPSEMDGWTQPPSKANAGCLIKGCPEHPADGSDLCEHHERTKRPRCECGKILTDAALSRGDGTKCVRCDARLIAGSPEHAERLRIRNLEQRIMRARKVVEEAVRRHERGHRRFTAESLAAELDVEVEDVRAVFYGMRMEWRETR